QARIRFTVFAPEIRLGLGIEALPLAIIADGPSGPVVVHNDNARIKKHLDSYLARAQCQFAIFTAGDKKVLVKPAQSLKRCAQERYVLSGKTRNFADARFSRDK